MAEDCTHRVSLDQLKEGQTATICSSTLDADDAAYLRSLGLRMNSTIRLCRAGEPCIVSIEGPHGCACRIGLSRGLAEQLNVDVRGG
jgi:Fe2+ transport system protein FeoA